MNRKNPTRRATGIPAGVLPSPSFCSGITPMSESRGKNAVASPSVLT